MFLTILEIFRKLYLAINNLTSEKKLYNIVIYEGGYVNF